LKPGGGEDPILIIVRRYFTLWQGEEGEALLQFLGDAVWGRDALRPRKKKGRVAFTCSKHGASSGGGGEERGGGTVQKREES